MLGAGRTGVFSKRAALRTPVSPHHAPRDYRVAGCRRERGAIGGRREAVRAAEARGERADALEANREVDLGYGAVGRPQQCRRAFEAPREQVRMGRLAEGAPEFPAEVRS